ncbi:MAG: phenylalanine--tRNA ligase subunit beta, partial [Oscillospiraceae bacterium]|nr:phenylalanine--tRNA ligase subunit beta [Oscillospiraceae bacterium]
MLLSRNWLNEFVDVSDISDHAFSEDMTLSGSKVETVARPDAEISGVVVGQILEMVRHENSDHMWVCQIDVGGAEPIQVVTGAQNQKVGDFVPVALPGASLPGGKVIECGTLRGVESNGMC